MWCRSIIIPILTFAGYIHQRTEMTKAVGICYVATQRAVLTAWNKLFLPFYQSFEIYITLVYPGFAWAGLRGLYLIPTWQCAATVIGTVSAHDCFRIRMLRASPADVAGTTKSRKHVSESTDSNGCQNQV